MSAGQFVVATPMRTMLDDNARALEEAGQLRFIALGTRRGTRGIPPERTRLNPWIGLAAYAFARTFSTNTAESLRWQLQPWFDKWVRRQLIPGDHIVSSYGDANASFQWVRRHGGTTIMDAGNSHIENYWELMNEEHRRWNWPQPPFSQHWLRRSRETIEQADYVSSPSQWVTDSFLQRGFPAEKILRTIYVTDLSCFSPASQPRPADRPLRVICTGQVSLRKGTPYLLEAFRLVLRQEPSARLLLTSALANNAHPILAKYRDLPIDWAPPLPHEQLALRLQSADVFVLPSLEEGMARTAAEAMACGLPVVLTRNTGTADYVVPGVSGTIVPTRDPQAIADAVLHWWEIIRQREAPPARLFDAEQLSFRRFADVFLGELRRIGLR